MGLIGPSATLPATFNGTRKFTFVLNARPGNSLEGVPIGGSMFYTLKFQKQTLSIVGQGTFLQTGSSEPVELFINLKK
jgi:hypothetical protein